ncbi:MAG TPA: DUF3881 family protein [Candidatus Fusicatenibacter merdavium]|uniref:DUF3881 family protein n=1 Tax=Candidatus Fusicatenibacter merdavium TaxID=2838600 RepID=A0A9D2BJ44_9FIRM|nr:DUF3881 family protein [Candidatus Fusicatenibacter merdavium]
MHEFLKTVGFSDLKSKKDLDAILRDVLDNYDTKKIVENEKHHSFVEISKEYGYDCGITVCGEYDEDGEFQMEYYHPYFTGGQITTYEDVSVERHAATESYAGGCDDLRLGITLIFYLINAADYLNARREPKELKAQPPLRLSGLARDGMILLPVRKDPEKVAKEKDSWQQKSSLLAAARDGDEDAIESLTMEDIDTYAMISRRIVHEDVLSIVDNYFMPYGLECDQYSILGEITDVSKTVNSMTGEKLWQMSILCNDVPLDICVNEKDLLGEPEVGRRFKGQIWLQGTIN